MGHINCVKGISFQKDFIYKSVNIIPYFIYSEELCEDYTSSQS